MRGGSVGFLGNRVKASPLVLLLLIVLVIDRKIRSRIRIRSRSGGQLDRRDADRLFR